MFKRKTPLLPGDPTGCREVHELTGAQSNNSNFMTSQRDSWTLDFIQASTRNKAIMAMRHTSMKWLFQLHPRDGFMPNQSQISHIFKWSLQPWLSDMVSSKFSWVFPNLFTIIGHRKLSSWIITSDEIPVDSLNWTKYCFFNLISKVSTCWSIFILWAYGCTRAGDK